MLKSLFATCLTALSVNTQPLVVPPSLESSSAITEDTTFNVGDFVRLEVTTNFDDYENMNLLLCSDTGVDTIKVSSFSMPSNIDYSVSSSNYSYPSFDYAYFVLSLNNNLEDIFSCDNFDDSIDFKIICNGFNSSFTYSFTFEILEGFEGFDSGAFPYLTKVENPYTPPAKSNLYRLLYDFYYSIFNDDDLTAITTGYNMPFDNWLAHTCTIATVITLIVVAFFFLRWLFRVISGLVLLKR